MHKGKAESNVSGLRASRAQGLGDMLSNIKLKDSDRWWIPITISTTTAMAGGRFKYNLGMVWFQGRLQPSRGTTESAKASSITVQSLSLGHQSSGWDNSTDNL